MRRVILLVVYLLDFTMMAEVIDNSIMVSSYRAVSDNVVNGSAFEKTVVSVSKGTVVLLPKRAQIYRDEEIDSIEIYTQKVLDFRGHPPHPMHIKDIKKYMGIAAKVRGDSLYLATYGEWVNGDGRAYMRLSIIIPKDQLLIQDSSLSGEKSIAYMAGNWWESALSFIEYFSALRSKQFQECYWYGKTTPKDGWTVLKSEPDTLRTVL